MSDCFRVTTRCPWCNLRLMKVEAFRLKAILYRNYTYLFVTCHQSMDTSATTGENTTWFPGKNIQFKLRELQLSCSSFLWSINFCRLYIFRYIANFSASKCHVFRKSVVLILLCLSPFAFVVVYPLCLILRSVNKQKNVYTFRQLFVTSEGVCKSFHVPW